MTEMLWLRVDGCPRGCRDAADRLDDLADRVERAAETLASDAEVSSTTFDGLAAAAFRGRAAAQTGPSRQTAADTTGLAGALRELAADLADVEQVMDTLAAQARPHLRVLPDRILAPDAPRAFQTEEAAWAAWDRLSTLHADARRLEQEAQADWSAAAAHFTHDDRLPLLPGLGLPVHYDPETGPHLDKD